MMIPDRVFKSIEHSFKGYKKYSDGQQVEVGYKPDYVLVKGNDYIILESENSSSRKMYVGGMIKAAHFLRDNRMGILVFVIKPKKNTKVSSIAKHLSPYFKWLEGRTKLKSVYVIDGAKYYSNNVVLEIGGQAFNDMAIKVQ